jgi:hypothetical protein
MTWISGAMVGLATTLGAVAHAEPKREVPDYDGRGNQDADADSWALWIPRILLSPLYVANEYVLRRPIGAVVRHAERERWADSVVQLFTFGEGGKSLIVPTALFDFGLLPSVGFYYQGDDLFAHGNSIRLHAATWGEPWINATAADRYLINKTDRVQVRFELKRSEDNLFFGIGPDVTRTTQSRYGLERVEGGVSYRGQLARELRLDAESGVHRISFVDGECCNDPSLDSRIAHRQLMPPPGYREPYTTAYSQFGLTLDSRLPRPDPGGGVYLHVDGRPSFDLDQSRSWIQYGGVLGGAVDLTGHRRTLRLQLAVELLDSMTGTTIPFTEYPSLGGELMPGFVAGWMTDRSTAAAQLAYSWPVWLGLDAQARFTIGNAFGEHLDGLAANKLRMSGDVGFMSSSAQDQGFEVLFGLGSETFEQGAKVTTVRVAVGSRRGF